ncbi:molybdopterin-containing oxidoreductase family membrane subunit [Bradymonas sediminis]|uniref:Polysulfide reductase n=2 Tax=Bradymonas sediminis TaxID=1548548 RepID=A0A2Z4FRS1_9DELT|nr:polysulfide reductase [Bradymonas sediminis]TDP76079.1 molybdopterin-containing oxidoreductase family membrane subunit [Bradymonas sediminis]
MSTNQTSSRAHVDKSKHLIGYPKFIWRSLVLATDGSLLFYAWMTLLTALALVGLNAWAHQVATGMSLTGMSDHVSWGLYIANFTFMVGLAAGGVMMVIPAYLYDDEQMHDVVIIGELLAIASIVMSVAFVVADMGRPDRLLHMMPVIGRFNWPISMLTWDMLVLNGYLIINLHICGYLLYKKFLGEKPDKRWYIPFVFLSIVWAISIHTVTAFLYSGLGGRPFWNSAILAPRFLVSAFVAGPAFIILSLQLIRRFSDFEFGSSPIRTLTSVLRVTVLINLFLYGAELFTEFYTGGSHTAAAEYLFFGLHGHTGLVAWTWSAIALNVTAALMLLHPASRSNWTVLNVACVLTFVGVWIEKGMGLVVPGFIPSTMHEIVEYSPSLVEWKVTIGIWALGLLVYTVALKIAIPIFSEKVTIRDGQLEKVD